MFKSERICPECNQGKIDTDKIFSGATCPSCNKKIEVNFTYVVFTNAVLCLGAITAMKYHFLFIGGLFMVLMVSYAFFFKAINASYFPLKNYEK